MTLGVQAPLEEIPHQQPQQPHTWVGSELAPPPPDHAAPQRGPSWVPSMCSTDVDTHTWYRVAYLGGIDLRVQPSFLAAKSGVVLPQNEVFPVSAEIVGSDGRIYLRLTD